MTAHQAHSLARSSSKPAGRPDYVDYRSCPGGTVSVSVSHDAVAKPRDPGNQRPGSVGRPARAVNFVSEISQRVLINSMPKSGTHLLARMMWLLGYEDFELARGKLQQIGARLGLSSPSALANQRVSRHWKVRLHRWSGRHPGQPAVTVDATVPVQVPLGLLQDWLEAVPPGHFLTAHLGWSPQAESAVQQVGFRQVLIIRDPRDVLVSFLHFVDRPQHPLSVDFRTLAPDQQVLFAVNGGQGPRSGRQLAGLKAAFQAILDWRPVRDVLTVNFEDLIGERGGGSLAVQQENVLAICRHLDIEASQQRVEHVCQQAFDSGAITFRRGQIGAWRDELSDEQIRLCTESFGDLLKAQESWT